MTKWNWILAIALALIVILLLPVLWIYRPQKIAYVDSARLLEGFKGMQMAKEAYRKQQGTWQANIDTLRQEVDRLVINFKKEDKSLTAKERQLSQELIRVKQGQLQNYAKALQVQAQQEEERMTKQVITNVNAFIKAYGQSHGYAIILAATGYGNIAYAEEPLDITPQILEGLNKEYGP
jgi:outer membrane protein